VQVEKWAGWSGFPGIDRRAIRSHSLCAGREPPSFECAFGPPRRINNTPRNCENPCRAAARTTARLSRAISVFIAPGFKCAIGPSIERLPGYLRKTGRSPSRTGNQLRVTRIRAGPRSHTSRDYRRCSRTECQPAFRLGGSRAAWFSARCAARPFVSPMMTRSTAEIRRKAAGDSHKCRV
jgi:hypothetical protein